MQRTFQLLLVACTFWACSALAVVDVYEFESTQQEKRYQQLTGELRCPKCQNQNLTGSDSQIAKDLRREVYRLVLEGKSNDEVKDFMVARYGDYVLYKPRLQSNTYVLWFAPVALLLIGMIIVALIVVRRRPKAAVANAPASSNEPSVDALSSEEQVRLKAMLENPELNGKE